MDDQWPLDGPDTYCHTCSSPPGAVAIPTGWDIAPDTPEVRNLMTLYTFSTHVVGIDWAHPGTGYHDIVTPLYEDDALLAQVVEGIVAEVQAVA